VSRIGKLPIPKPEDVKATLQGGKVVVEGPKGKNEVLVHRNISVEIEKDRILVKRPDDSKFNRALHGLTRALINNAVIGVTKGFTKKLEIEGVGYRASMSTQSKGGLTLELGFSHKIEVAAPEGIKLAVPAPTQIVVTGIDKQTVGEIAAKIRSYRPPEPYKGKGVRYSGEVILRKAGKTGATAAVK
jgi:large subunit ribosomal protein L6